MFFVGFLFIILKLLVFRSFRVVLIVALNSASLAAALNVALKQLSTFTTSITMSDI